MEVVSALGQGAAKSRLWRSPAWPPGGPPYVNAALRLATDLSPEARTVVQSAYGTIQRGHDRARDLKMALQA